ncbi:hypothetical protein GCM10027277_55660 [Pseudoduganella ginsengisoli]|uniref:DUF4214 domain-containing protein n=1 Tax=Pseudoduganella ginsengisoli TaxID=1462440 RepID=A0A6L6Q787_9BURK|nr:DUF4214 domain-containing protein [Pseudoduganella ginsengisoli]MTW05002.1 DUF4214 domain-containing protein [Pseudoduganella ginsengisoli]
MKPTANDIQQLYIAYFNRPADPDGLRYWTGIDATQDSIAAAFATAHEFNARYANMSNRDMVKALYHNLFGRAGETGGVDYWSSVLDNGSLKRDNVALAMVHGAQGEDAVALANKVSFAQDLTAKIPVIQPYVTDSGIAAITGMWLDQVTDTASLQIARTALTEYVAHPGAVTTMISGQAQGVGYLRDATVFVDSNGNGLLDRGEQSTKTDANGHFLLASSQSSDFPLPQASWQQHVLVTGGYDLATERAHNGTLSLTVDLQHTGSTPANTLVRANASAMTTLRDAMVRTGVAADAVDAALSTAFGVKVNAAADSMNAALDAEPAARAAALQGYAYNAEIDGIAEVVARTLQMLSARMPDHGSGYVAPKLSLDVAMRAAYEGMASVLVQLKGSAPLDSGATLLQVLTTAATLPHLADGTVLDGTAAKSLAALSTATLDAFKQMMGAAIPQARADISNTSDPWTVFAHAAQARAALDDLADTLPRAMAENKAASLLPQWTDAAVKERITAKDVGDLDPYSHNDTAATAKANGAPPAMSKLAVEQAYVAILNRPAEPDALQKWMAKGDAAALATELRALPEWHGKGSDAEAVNALYLNLFGRSAEVAGLTYWTSVLHDKKIDLATLTQYLVNSASGSDAIAARDKIAGALEFTSALSAPDLADAYHANPTAGNVWMTGIVDDATLKNALDLLPDFLLGGGPVVITGVQQPLPL